MDLTFLVRRKADCSRCKGVGFLPLEGDTGSPGATIEIMCSKCKGKKVTWKKENLTLESLRELLK